MHDQDTNGSGAYVQEVRERLVSAFRGIAESVPSLQEWILEQAAQTEWQHFNYRVQRLIPRKSGIYCVFDEGTTICVYVGMASDMYSRLACHRVKVYYKTADIYCLEIRELEYRPIVESEIAQCLRPLCGSHPGVLDRYATAWDAGLKRQRSGKAA